MKKFAIFCFSLLIVIGVSFFCWNYNKQNEEEKEITTIACVGDSLTFSRSFTGEVHLYPTYLAEKLDEKYYVVNYGIAGSCLQGDLPTAYTSTRAYKASLEKQADIIIIMLGSNDVFSNNWRDEEAFYRYYVELVDSYLENENTPEIYLCTIPKIYMEDSEAVGYEVQEKADKIVKIIERIANEKKLHLIDMNEITSNHPEWYLGDKLHFNYEGTIGVAEVIYDAIINPTKITCVGDSITYRYGFEEEPENNYPYVLDNLLGAKYTVKNFGESGTCVQKNTDYAYVNQNKYIESLDYDADILIFTLGTNDSKKWNWKDKETFRTEYETLLDSYLSNDPDLEVYIGISPKSYYIDDKVSGTAEFGIEPQTVDEIAEIQYEVAKERGYQIIDLYELSEQHPEWFAEDGIHPTRDGAIGIAEYIAEILLNEK